MWRVVSLGPEPPPGEACQKTVELLRKWLEMAERGDLIGAALCGVKPNMAITTEWDGSATAALMLTAVSVLQHRVSSAFESVDGDWNAPVGAA